MARKLGTSAVAFMAVVATGGAGMAHAAPRCAKPKEVTAIQVAAIQQELMVAALTCNQIADFNAFQTSYSKDLRSSDKELMHMFHRLFGHKGSAEYHAFKTRLANNSSMRSIHDNSGYCQEAKQVFAAALVPARPTLAAFVSGVTVHDEGPVDSCDMRVATGLAGANAAANVVPTPNPLRVAALAPAPAAVTPAAAITAPPAVAGPVAAAPQQVAAQQTQTAAAAPAEKPEKKASGWLSGLFN